MSNIHPLSVILVLLMLLALSHPAQAGGVQSVSADKTLIYSTPEFDRKMAEFNEDYKKRRAKILRNVEDVKQQKLRSILSQPISPSPDPEKSRALQRLFEDRLNPLRARLSESWVKYGNGVTYVHIHFTVLPGRKIRLDHARVAGCSNAPRDADGYLLPGVRDKILESIHKTLASVDGDQVLDNALRADPEFSYNYGLNPGKVISKP